MSFHSSIIFLFCFVSVTFTFSQVFIHEKPYLILPPLYVSLFLSLYELFGCYPGKVRKGEFRIFLQSSCERAPSNVTEFRKMKNSKEVGKFFFQFYTADLII